MGLVTPRCVWGIVGVDMHDLVVDVCSGYIWLLVLLLLVVVLLVLSPLSTYPSAHTSA